MNTILSILTFAVVIAGCVYLHWKLFNLKTVTDYEESVAGKFQARSHRLVLKRQEIDLMPQGFAKLAAHDEWLESVYSYIEDYEEAVAQDMKDGNFTELKAYGGIKLIG